MGADNNAFITHGLDGAEIVYSGGKVTAKHFSEGKSGVDQIPPQVLLELGRVYEMGERKYGRRNWLKGTAWHEFYGSALRHILRWQSGEDLDDESGLPHLSHAIWNLVALQHFQMNGIGTDDRLTGSPLKGSPKDLLSDYSMDTALSRVRAEQDIAELIKRVNSLKPSKGQPHSGGSLRKTGDKGTA